jgi:hypothetical protein
MKLNGKILVAVAMMVGSMAAVGCAAPVDADAVAPEESAATAPVEDNASTPGFEQNSVHARYGARHYYAPKAPPMARREVYGRAPSANHFWAPGYYRWNGRQHVWTAGRWEAQRVGYTYIGPQWQRRDTRWEYIPGRWVLARR